MSYPRGYRSIARRTSNGYVLAVLMVVLVVGLRIVATPFFGMMSPFLFMALAVFVSAWWGGIGSGIFATVLSTVSVAFFFLEPSYTFKILRPEGALEVAIFLVESAIIVLVCEALRHARAGRRRQSRIQTETLQRLDDATAETLRAKLKLHDLDTLLRLVTSSLPVAIAYLDASETYRFCNQVYAQWYGSKWPNVIGKTAKEVMGDDLYASMQGNLKRALSGQYFDVDAEVPFRDKPRFVRVHAIPDFQEGGRVSGFVVLSTDLSDQRQQQQELLRAKEAADAANQAKSAFLANMSHEIRTPLGAILGFSELLISPNQSQSDRITWVSAIKRNGDLLSTIINDILDLSKVEAGKVDVEHHDVPLEEILTDLTTLLNLQAAEKGIRLSISADRDLPGIINTDPLRLRQILLNIVGNAIKFTPKGSVDVRLEMIPAAGAESAAKLAFIVKDTGPGIAKEQATTLFEPFSQADASTKRKFGGTGLGLVLARRLANLLGGDVRLTESTLGKGSTFTITIDPGQVQQHDKGHFEVRERLLKPDVASDGLNIRLDGMRVLLVEDSQDNRLLVGRLLKTAGAEVETAENGRGAIEMAHHQRYDVVLMDIQMPDVDGMEATEVLRREGYKAPIIALTAHALKAERERCLASGFDEHISKPVDRKTLLKVLARYRRPGAAGEPPMLLH